jgi:hypothetical protein
MLGQDISHARTSIDLRMRNISLSNRPTVEIVLDKTDGVHGNYITSFVTMDSITGHACITAKNDTKFDNLEISFVGEYHESVFFQHACSKCGEKQYRISDRG